MNFSQDFFSGNRRRLQTRAGTDLIVISANGLLQSSADGSFPFRQDSNFWYLTGVDEPDIILVTSGADEFLVTPSRDKNKVIFDGAINKATLAKTAGINEVLDEAEGWQRISGILKETKNIGTLIPFPSYIKQAGLYTNPAAARLTRRLKTSSPGLSFTDLREPLAAMRIIKQPPELKAIREAVDITADSFREVLTRAQQFDWEYQLEAALNSGFCSRGASRPAFPTIVAGGANACTLHYISNNHKLHKRDLVLIDAGAELSHYSGDITRTISLAAPSTRQQEVYDSVLAVQKFAVSLLKPGTMLKDYAAKVDSLMGDMLQSLGLIKRGDEESIRQYFPHSVSHFLGLDVHDGRGWQKPLEPGMVLTVEPGIYIAREGIGIRIEDDILITNNGHEVLSANLPRKLI